MESSAPAGALGGIKPRTRGIAMTVTYTVDTLRAGQPRAYADSEYEYRITIARDGKPWFLGGDIEATAARDEADRKAGRMIGGATPDDMRKMQGDWARQVIRALCQNFRERDDEDGRVGMAGAFFPTLRWLRLDAKAGTIHVMITSLYTD
jgi:hypothetical protein